MEDRRVNRVLIAKVGCDIHERGALTLLSALSNAGMEVIYTGRYQTPKAVADAALAEDVDVIALSDHTGSLPIIAEQVLVELQSLNVSDIAIIAGGLLTPDDVRALKDMGVTGNYGPGTPIDVIIEHINGLVGR